MSSQIRSIVSIVKQVSACLRAVARKVRPATSLLLVATLITISVPPAITRSAAQEAIGHSNEFVGNARDKVANWLEFTGLIHDERRRSENRGMPAELLNSASSSPLRPFTKEEREEKVNKVETNAKDLRLESGQRVLLAAIPLDARGNAIHSLVAKWESSNPKVIAVTSTGEVLAGAPGNAHITASAGSKKAGVKVTVVAKVAAKNEPNSSATNGDTRKRRSSAGDIAGIIKRAHAREAATGSSSVDTDRSLYTPSNAVGAPPGKTTPGAMTAGAAAESTEMPGSSNFSFSLGVVNLPGRGADIDLPLTYNSRIFHKYGDGHFGYDIDMGWPAPGFKLGYGYMEWVNNIHTQFEFTLAEPNGTRHLVTRSNWSIPNYYDTFDGSSIHFDGTQNGGTATHPDGTRIDYGAVKDVTNPQSNGQTLRTYPTRITDRNGNTVLISYVGGVGPRIFSIQDTLGRYVYFKYAANNDLVTITAPGMTGQPDRQVIRFYYQDMAVSTSFQAFAYAPATSRVIKYIYLPNSVESSNAHIGYRYDYSSYGMIYQITQFRGMTVSTSDPNNTGSVSTEGTQAALTTYNYQGTPVNPANNLAEVPNYTTRTDDWAGRVSALPVYSFSVNAATGVSTVTAPDGTINETHTIVNPGQWNDGLVNETIVKNATTTFSDTVFFWQPFLPGGIPQLFKVETSNEAVTGDPNKTKVTTYEYDSITLNGIATTYNNVSKIHEHDFAPAGTIGTELRRTETTYVTSTAYIGRGLVKLPSSVEVWDVVRNTLASQTDYTYDEPARLNLNPLPGIIQYTDPASPYRGDLTTVTKYADTSNPNAPSCAISYSTNYDSAGNITSATVDCCQVKSFVYSPTYFYAYVTSVTTGGGPTVTTTASYDLPTGLVGTVTDENSQPTTTSYFLDSLRPEHTDFPDGGAVFYQYNDSLTPDLAGRQHYFIRTSTRLDATRIIDSFRFFDGRGAVTQTFDNFTSANGWSTQDIEYDVIGRAHRTSNPYYSAGYGSTQINPTGLWTTKTFDNLNRVTRVDMPSGDAQNPTTTFMTSGYSGVFTTVTDPAGKQRRQKVDALGRVIRQDEPDGSGNLGANDAPTQPTAYEYDVLDNLIHITQGSQHRYFKYDSISRLTHERQVEQDAPWTTSDAVAGNTQWSRKLVYNANNLIQDAYDARQINTHFVYDGLNRVLQVTYSDGTPATFYWYDSQSLPTGAPSFNRGYSTGRLVATTYGSITSTTGSYFGDYDKLGRVKTHKQVTGTTTYSMSYTYNLAGLLTGETYPSLRAITYAYDEGGRLSQVSDGTTTYASGFTYAPQGGLTSETFGNGAVHSLTYNNALQASQIKLKQSASGAELQRFDYSYGKVDQASGSVDTTKNNGQIGRIDGYINAVKQWDQRFVYDSLSRLSTAAEYRGDTGAQTYQAHYDYDRYGNRHQYQSNSNLAYTPVQTTDLDAARNRFISSGPTPTSYDPAGNILSDTKFRNLNYTYDANNRQISASGGGINQTSVYDCTGQRVQTTTGGVTRTMVYNIFGQQVADYTGSTGTILERENIYRAGQLLATSETSGAAAPSGLATTPSSTNVTLSWTAAAGATNYRVERKSAGGSYTLLGATSSTNLSDSGAILGSAYLYRVCSADAQNNCTSGYSNIVLGARLNFTTDSTITSIVDDPTGVNVTTVKAAHITELRTAVNAVRSLAGLSAATWTNPTLTPGVSLINADDVRDLRTKLDEALIALTIQTSSYTDPTLAGAPNGTVIKKAHITDLRQRATSGSGTGGSGGSGGGLKYVLTDVQGSARAMLNNNGVGTSTVVARHDYLPFGEEIGSGTGLRTTSQGYGAVDGNRRKYALTERDEATGLDHTWWRKYENRSGRWTTPDPYGGSMVIANPQSFNRYAYVANDPVNQVDPTGLVWDSPRMCFVLVQGFHTFRGERYVSTTITSVETFCLSTGGFLEFEREPQGPPYPGGNPNQYAQLDPCPELVVPAFDAINQAAATLLKNTYGSGAEAAYGRMTTYEKAVFLNTAAGAASVGVNFSNAKFDHFYRSDKPGNLPYGFYVTGASGKLEGRHADIGSVELDTKKGLTQIDIDLFKGGLFNKKHHDEVAFNKKYNRPTHPGDVTRQLTKRGVDSGVKCKP